MAIQKPLRLTLDEEESGLTSDPVTHISEGDEIFGTDDGFNLQRESLLKYRVAHQCLLAEPGRDSMYRANNLAGTAERLERELEGVKDILISQDTPVINETKVIDVGK